ncbi:secreted antigen 1 [Babesia divergens]|uniref:Secreted antigen 1 n=1 Tax=Babesia divergens TaxID=32595 RepID=A0AAD9LEJ2_BABDI|nr:secreted antigen 1 [Babesia divergens]
MLDFIGKLGSNQPLLEKVLSKIVAKVGADFNPSTVSGQSLNDYLKQTFTKVAELRNLLLQNPKSFGNYPDFDDSDDAEDKYAKKIIDILPVVHGELSYLYFQTSSKCASRGGHRWADNCFGSTSTSDVHKWLTDETGKGVGLIKRGFTDNILKFVDSMPDAAPLGIEIKQGGPLNHSQFGLFFVASKWSDSNLANAMLFLKEFCKDIHGSKFVEQFKNGTPVFNHDVLRNLCFTISTDLNNMSRGILPLFEHLKPVKGSDQAVTFETKYDNIYNDRLKAESFRHYVDWIKANANDITNSLEKMRHECRDWSPVDLKDATSEGPFKYGFVFPENWHDFVDRDMTSTTKSISDGLNELVSYFTSPPQRTATIEDPTLPAAPAVVGGEGASESIPVAEGAAREDSNLRTADDAVTPKESESPAKPSSFVSTPFVGCFVTLGFLLSMM